MPRHHTQHNTPDALEREFTEIWRKLDAVDGKTTQITQVIQGTTPPPPPPPPAPILTASAGNLRFFGKPVDIKQPGGANRRYDEDFAALTLDLALPNGTRVAAYTPLWFGLTILDANTVYPDLTVTWYGTATKIVGVKTDQDAPGFGHSLRSGEGYILNRVRIPFNTPNVIGTFITFGQTENQLPSAIELPDSFTKNHAYEVANLALNTTQEEFRVHVQFERAVPFFCLKLYIFGAWVEHSGQTLYGTICPSA